MKYKILKKLVFITVLTVLLPFMGKAQNPIVQTHFGPDPAPMVYNGTLYSYLGDDIPGSDFYYMTKWRVLSTADMVNWTDYGSPISLESFKWARKRIKSNVRTSHIPVILLTARTSEQLKMTGYQSGADEYLAKPFNLEILLLRIDKLIAQKNQRQSTFSKKLEVNPKEITITSIDKQLIQKALGCMEINMDNPDYSVQQFSQDLGVERTVLYKKLHSITGLAPSEFIRSIRLKRAAQLLIQGHYPVAEVA